MPEEFENEALSLRLDLPSTLIRHENGAGFSKTLFKRMEFAFTVWTATVLNTELLENNGVAISLKPDRRLLRSGDGS